MGSHFLLPGIFRTHWLNSSPALAVGFLAAEAPGKLGCWKPLGKSRVSILKKKKKAEEKKNSRNRHSFKCPCERQQRPKKYIYIYLGPLHKGRLGVRCYTLMKHQNPAGSVTVKLGKLQPGGGLQISLSSQPFDPRPKPLNKMAWSSPSPKKTLMPLSIFLYLSISTQTLPLGTRVSTAGISELETWLQSTTQAGGDADAPSWCCSPLCGPCTHASSTTPLSSSHNLQLLCWYRQSPDYRQVTTYSSFENLL